LLLRIGRRRSFIPTLDEFLQVEFTARSGGRDLHPSVYEIGPDEVIQAYAEHVASFLVNPPRGAKNWDVGDAGGTLVVTEGGTRFAFTRNAHRELGFPDEAALARFVQCVYEESRERGRHDVSRVELEAYVRARRAASDREWLLLLDSPECSDAWRTLSLR
jgi:hypothetical protein